MSLRPSDATSADGIRVHSHCIAPALQRQPDLSIPLMDGARSPVQLTTAKLECRNGILYMHKPAVPVAEAC